MSLFDPAMGPMNNDFFPSWTNSKLRLLRPGEYQVIIDDIDKHFEAHLADPRYNVGVAMNYPGDWPQEIEPLYRVCSGLTDHAAMLAGNVYARVAIARPELWWTFNDARLAHKPRRYICHDLVQRNLLGI